MTQGSGFDPQLWQRRAVHVLGVLLQRAARESLPPIVWSVGTGAPTLIGRVTARDNTLAQRLIWRAWVNVVGAKPLPVRERDGQVHLHAIAENVEGLAVVAIVTDIDTTGPRHRKDSDEHP
jgi:hypothetical protein